MGHESQIEPWLPLTTVLLVSFRADWLRREETMKTARKENRNCWAAVFSIRVDGLAGQNSALITWGWKQEKLQPSREKNFLLTSPSIELPSGPLLECSRSQGAPRDTRLSADFNPQLDVCGHPVASRA